MTEHTDAMIDAADKHADAYEGHGDLSAEWVRCAITNAFYAGAKWQSRSPAPPAQPMTEEQIEVLYNDQWYSTPGVARAAPLPLAPMVLRFARAIERFHGVK